MRVNQNIAAFLKNFTLHENKNASAQRSRKSKTRIKLTNPSRYPKYINEFWTSKQRQSSSIHEIAYRACFKPELPRFFIKQLTKTGDLVYDPFAGRGTTIIEAALLGRRVVGNDINPLSRILTLPRLNIPTLNEVEERLKKIQSSKIANAEFDLKVFYDQRTLREIIGLRDYLHNRKETGQEDHIDSWIRMVATNRLSGHSTGFFSVYTLPPNQAASVESQAKINKKRNQKPEYRNTREIILRKSRLLIRDLTEIQKTNLALAASNARFYADDARFTQRIASNSIQLTVTSPPFLDIVQYPEDNWLRWWFNRISATEVEGKITSLRSVAAWSKVMLEVFIELYRITRRNGWVAFEVGEVNAGRVDLDEYVLPLGIFAGFRCKGILINKQRFTKTANIWGIHNNSMGTNTNRVVIFRKE